MQYDLLFVGATTLACAWAETATKNGETCLIAESTGIVGYDYADTWITDPGLVKIHKEKQSDFFQELMMRDAVNEQGIIHCPAVGCVLSGRLKNIGADCVFFSRITGIYRCVDGFRVNLFSFDGTQEIYAKKIIDTTSGFLTRVFFNQPEVRLSERTLTVLLSPTKLSIKFSHREGCFGEGIYCRIPVKKNENYSSAIHRIVCMRNEHPAWFGNAEIIHFAPFIYEKPCEKIRDFSSDALWVPSMGYDDPVEAYETGISFATAVLSPKEQAYADERAEINDGEYDLVVAGMGTAGSVAAIYAAKLGLKVLGIENLNSPGGAATSGGIYYYYLGEQKSGFYREIDKVGHELCDNVMVLHPSNAGGPRKLVALEDNMQKYGVECVYNADVCGVLSEEETVVGVKYICSDGIHTVRAKQVIDATADGIVCLLAGCDMLSGRSCDGKFLPYTSEIQLYNPIKKIYRTTGYDSDVVDHYNKFEFGKSIIRANSDEGHLYTSYKSEEIYMGTSQLTGLRQGLRIVGEEVLKVSDVLNDVYTDEPMFYMVSSIDTHSKDMVFEDPVLRDWYVIAGMWRYVLKIPVSHRILIPKGRKGLLVAGRHLSVDSGFSYALRMMDDMSRSGEAAALIAYYAIKSGLPACDMPYELFRKDMMKYGALCSEDRAAVYKLSGTQPVISCKDSVWIDDIDKIKQGLSSDDCGYAMWSARKMGEKIRPYLNLWLNSKNKNLKVNSALSMALCGFKEAENVLYETLDDFSGYVPSTSDKYILPRTVSVITACGRLRLTNTFDKIFKFFKDPSITDVIPVKIGGFYSCREDVRFQFRSCAFIALVEILKFDDELSKAKAPLIQKVLSEPNFELSTTMSGSKIRFDRVSTVKKIWNENFSMYCV